MWVPFQFLFTRTHHLILCIYLSLCTTHINMIQPSSWQFYKLEWCSMKLLCFHLLPLSLFLSLLIYGWDDCSPLTWTFPPFALIRSSAERRSWEAGSSMFLPVYTPEGCYLHAQTSAYCFIFSLIFSRELLRWKPCPKQNTWHIPSELLKRRIAVKIGFG